MAVDQKRLDDSKDRLARAQVIISKIATVKNALVVSIDDNKDLEIPLGVQVDVLSLWEDRAQALIDGAVTDVPQIGPVKGEKIITPAPIEDAPPEIGV